MSSTEARNLEARLFTGIASQGAGEIVRRADQVEIVLDLTMPVMGGDETFRATRPGIVPAVTSGSR